MNRKEIAIIFALLFMSFIVTPSIMAVFGDSTDTSILLSSSEEEEHSNSKMETPFSSNSNDLLTGSYFQPIKFFNYQFKNYQKPHLNLISPPPDHIIL